MADRCNVVICGNSSVAPHELRMSGSTIGVEKMLGYLYAFHNNQRVNGIILICWNLKKMHALLDGSARDY